MRSKFLAILLPCTLLCHYGLSQLQFSQTCSNPLSVNPAFTGKFDGDYRAGGVLRSERSQVAAETRGTVFFDSRLLKSTLPEHDRFAFGLGAGYQRNPFLGIRYTSVQLSIAYHKALNEDGTQQIGFGFQAGLVHRHIDLPDLIFEEQILRYGMEGAVLLNQKTIDFSYGDYHLGLDYQGRLNDWNTLFLGLSLLHANHPSKLVNGGEFFMDPQASLQLGWEYRLDDRSKLLSNGVLLMTTKDRRINDLIAGCTYQTKVNESNYLLGMGAAFRRSDLNGMAIIPGISLGYAGFSLNLSYDIAVSYRTTDQRGSFELGLIYTGKRKSRQ